jgi:hypothetical protein
MWGLLAACWGAGRSWRITDRALSKGIEEKIVAFSLRLACGVSAIDRGEKELVIAAGPVKNVCRASPGRAHVCSTGSGLVPNAPEISV